MALCPGVPAGCDLACLRLSRASSGARARWAAAVYQRSCLVLCGAPVQQAAPPPRRGRLLPSQRWCLASRDRATWIPAMAQIQTPLGRNKKLSSCSGTLAGYRQEVNSMSKIS